MISFYATEGNSWNSEAISEIRDLSNQIYTVLSQVIMCKIMKETIFTDMMVGIPNVTGFFEFAAKVLEDGKLNQYHILYLNIHNFKFTQSEKIKAI